jgi:hypothetical protein
MHLCTVIRLCDCQQWQPNEIQKRQKRRTQGTKQSQSRDFTNTIVRRRDVFARVSQNRNLHVRDDTNYQVLVYPTLTDAPPCWLLLAPALKELLALEEDSEEEKESISKVVVVFVIEEWAVFCFLDCPVEHRAVSRGRSHAPP